MNKKRNKYLRKNRDKNDRINKNRFNNGPE